MHDPFDFIIGLCADRLDLPLVAVPPGLGFQERAQRRDVPLAQHLAELRDVRPVVGGHRRGSAGQPWFGQGGWLAGGPGGPDCQAVGGPGGAW